MLVTPTSAALWLTALLAQAAPLPETVPAAPPLPSTAPRHRVEVAIAGSAQELERLSPALSDALRRLGVEPALRLVPAVVPRALGEARPLSGSGPEAAAPLARLFVDLKGRGKVALYVVDDRRERVFVRRFAKSGESAELLDEQLVLAVSSSVDAILAGQLIGMPRRDYEAAEQPARERPAPLPPPAPTRAAGSLSGRYGVSWLGAGAFTHGPSLGLTLDHAPWGLGVSAQGRLPVLVGQRGDVLVRLTSLGFRYRAWYELLTRGADGALVGLGFGGDFTQVSPRQGADGNATALPPYWAADGLVQGYLGFAHRAPGFRFALEVGVDCAAAPVRYALDTTAGNQTVFEPFRVRPFLELEFAAGIR